MNLVLLLICSLSFLMNDRTNDADRSLDGIVLATVDGYPITFEQLQKAWNRTSYSRESILSPEKENLLQYKLLQLLIDQRLIHEYLNRMHIEVSDEDLDRYIQLLREKNFEQGRSLEMFLEYNNASPNEMRQEIHDMLRWYRFIQQVGTDDALRNYFESNRDLFNDKMVRLREIRIDVSPFASSDSKDNIRQKLVALRKMIVSGAPFHQIAFHHSDSKSKFIGGDLGFVYRRNSIDEDVARLAFFMPKGKISGVLETQDAMYLIQVTHIKPGKSIDYADSLSEIGKHFTEDMKRGVLIEMRRSSKIQLFVDRLESLEMATQKPKNPNYRGLKKQ